MGRYLYPELARGFAAVVSTHGYFEIQKAESYNSYAATITAGLSGGVWRTNEDGTRTRCPIPEVVYDGDVEELGLRYEPEHDDLHEDDCDGEVIRAALLQFLDRKRSEQPVAGGSLRPDEASS